VPEAVKSTSKQWGEATAYAHALSTSGVIDMFHIAHTTPVLHETLGIPVPAAVRGDVARIVAIRVLVSFAVIAVSASIGASFA
jgi:hypothetical protein